TDRDLFLPPLISVGSQDDAQFSLLDADGDKLGTFTSDTQLANIFGISSTAFVFDRDDFHAADGSDGGTGDDGGGAGGVEASDIASALRDAGITNADFDDDDANVSALAQALAGSNLDFGSGDITGDDV